MKKIDISITKAMVLQEVGLNSAYSGAKSGEDKELVRRVMTVPEDGELLTMIFKEICGEVCDRLKEHITDTKLEDEKLEMTLTMSGAFDDSLTPTIHTGIYTTIVAGVTAGWFRYAYPGRAEEWSRRSEGILSRVVSKLCQRRKPVRSC